MLDATLDYLRGLRENEAVRPIDINALLHSMANDSASLGREIAIEGRALTVNEARPQEPRIPSVETRIWRPSAASAGGVEPLVAGNPRRLADLRDEIGSVERAVAVDGKAGDA